jgi:DNA-binding Xre family transcriptional regulator
MVAEPPLGKPRKKARELPAAPPTAAEPTEGRSDSRQPEGLTVENARLRVELARAEARLSRPAPLPPEHFQTATTPLPPPADLAKTLAENLRILCAVAGISQRELADRAGVSKNHVSLVMGGSANVTLATIQKLAGALDRAPLDLLTKKIV